MGIFGIFSNKKKPCPICGKGTPRLLATKIAEETPLCSDCGKKISMTEAKVLQLSVEELKEHLAMREENAKCLQEIFRPNKSIDFTWSYLNIDEENHLFTLPIYECGDIKNPPVFRFDELMGYELVDKHGLIESCFRGEAAPQLTQAAFDPIILDSDRKRSAKGRRLNINRKIKLNLFLSNPYWDKVEADAGDVVAMEYSFQEEYIELLEQLRPITAALAEIMGIDGIAVEQIDPDAIAEEIKKFQELLDGGIITEEEFNDKKKELLGI